MGGPVTASARSVTRDATWLRGLARVATLRASWRRASWRRTPWRRALRGGAPTWLCWLLCAACQAESKPALELTVGGETTRFETHTAFAEYWELSGQADELRITLASYPVSCDEFVPPPEGETVVTVSVLVPEGKRIELGDYPWTGVDGLGDAPRNPATPYALPFVRVAGRGFPLAPGGAIRVAELEPRVHGRVTGLLSFQGVSEDAAAATRLTGRFEAKLCRYSPLPAPPGAE